MAILSGLNEPDEVLEVLKTQRELVNALDIEQGTVLAQALLAQLSRLSTNRGLWDDWVNMCSAHFRVMCTILSNSRGLILDDPCRELLLKVFVTARIADSAEETFSALSSLGPRI